MYDKYGLVSLTITSLLNPLSLNTERSVHREIMSVSSSPAGEHVHGTDSLVRKPIEPQYLSGKIP